MEITPDNRVTKTTSCSNNLLLATQPSLLLASHVSRVSLAINRRCSVHLELLAPKDLYVAISLVGGVKGGRRVDVIAQVRVFFSFSCVFIQLI